jgi:hypothetical protein
MTVTEFAATAARAFMAAEIAMASANCRDAGVTRAEAEKLLSDYFDLVDRAVVQPASCPIGCVMIQSLPARASRLYAQFLREFPKATRRRSIKDYH